MEPSNTREAASCAAAQKLSKLLWNPKLNYRVRKRPLLVSILSQTNLFQATRSYPYNLATNNLCKFLFYPIRVTCHAHLIVFGVVVQIMLDEEYKS
jgi:hypothetical protein